MKPEPQRPARIALPVPKKAKRAPRPVAVIDGRTAAFSKNGSSSPTYQGKAKTYPDEASTILCEIPVAVRDLWKVCDPDSPRYALMNVELTRDAEGNCEAVATDSRRLHVYTWNDGFIGAPFHTQVPRDQFRYAIRILPKQHYGDRVAEDGTVEKVAMGWAYQDQHQGATVLKKGKTVEMVEYKCEGRFPKWRSVPFPSTIEQDACSLDLTRLGNVWAPIFRSTTQTRLTALFDEPKTRPDRRTSRYGLRTLLPFDDDRCYELPVFLFPDTPYLNGQKLTEPYGEGDKKGTREVRHSWQLGILRRGENGVYDYDEEPTPGIFNRVAWETRMGTVEVPADADEADQRDASKWGETMKRMNHVELSLNFLFDTTNAFKSLGSKRLRFFPNRLNPSGSIAFYDTNADNLSLLSIVMPIAPDGN